MIDRLDQLLDEVRRFSTERDWQRFHDPKNRICPFMDGGQSKRTDQYGPGFYPLVPQQDRPPGTPIGVKFPGDGHKVTYRMLPTGQSNRPAVAGHMLAQ